MTEKRFVDYFDKDHNYIIQDLVNEDEYQVGFVNCDEDKFLELVNALAETSCDCITDCEIVMKKLKDENEQLKKDRFVCLDCKYCGHTEIGCLCEKQDHWEDFKNECNNFKELKYYSGDAE